MTWIETIPINEATGKLKKLYQRIAGPNGEVDHIMQAHSLRPHTLEGHMALYKNVLHHMNNSLPKWLLEAAGVYASWLNGCDYCVEHHSTGLARLLDDEARLRDIVAAIEADAPEQAFEGRELAAMCYVRLLTTHPASIEKETVDGLRDAGLSDGEILELNQVAAYFAYANRTVLGLGCSTRGEGEIGLSPGDSADEKNWTHQ